MIQKTFSFKFQVIKKVVSVVHNMKKSKWKKSFLKNENEWKWENPKYQNLYTRDV